MNAPTTDQHLRAAKSRRMTAILAAGIGLAVMFGLEAYLHTHAGTGSAPLSLGFPIPGQMKEWFTRGSSTLALLQLATGLRIDGRIRTPRRLPPWMPTAHRIAGVAAVLLAAPVAWDCVSAFGSTMLGSTRVVVHATAGCVLFAAIAAKVFVVERRRRPRWLIPAIGLTLFLSLMTLLVTSIGWPISLY